MGLNSILTRLSDGRSDRPEGSGRCSSGEGEEMTPLEYLIIDQANRNTAAYRAMLIARTLAARAALEARSKS